jgi:hypothetical protein
MILVLAGAGKNIGFVVKRRNNKVTTWTPKL